MVSWVLGLGSLSTQWPLATSEWLWLVLTPGATSPSLQGLTSLLAQYALSVSLKEVPLRVTQRRWCSVGALAQQGGTCVSGMKFSAGASMLACPFGTEEELYHCTPVTCSTYCIIVHICTGALLLTLLYNYFGFPGPHED